ncbi:Protein of unknown function, DUF608 [Pustulibacterium marinum]|uniref:Alpha-L-rhamnosidase six-hairpin glycosidase domain-containing protein n=1 Tax=Pustulibacterium marinum TaxID=1224947 RepID=A0A1I7FS66_9FLAO|nr:DUF4450 domain-containing protein [Pustulibacterium marinum]SFU39064.1 Protein of unknown function, DUF608 [Pustulibacterium marinum]
MFKFICLGVILFWSISMKSQTESSQNPWHDTPREIHYKPNGTAFQLVAGNRKFNRALYGTNTGFRVEAGDLPEFAMYMPGMSGNFKIGIQVANQSKWITKADSITTSYIPGTMLYTIQDALLQNGKLQLQLVALADAEGFVLKVTTEAIPENVSLIWTYGGATGKKFHRDGDIGADPESVFYLLPEYCLHNTYQLHQDSFELNFKWDTKTQQNTRTIQGYFPTSTMKIADANQLNTPAQLWNSAQTETPVVTGKLTLTSETAYFWKLGTYLSSNTEISKDFEKGIEKTQTIRNRVQLTTPDPYLNTLGGALAIAADGIWEDPAYLHGAVAWRMHLNAWRGAYVADPLGWHDRAKTHFTSYLNSQVTSPKTGPVVPDTSRFMARQVEKIGNSMFSSGYISRHPNRNDKAHHYDMNLVFFDQLLKHFDWTGDTEFIKATWPAIKRHLAWEKRNYDTDGDGLYDAYAAIWASDALQYAGSGVSYTSAYNFSANKTAAQLASIVGENPEPYEKEAEKIQTAIQKELWIPEKGIVAEYKDLLGNELPHEQPGIWSVYHTIDEAVLQPEQAQQLLQYVTDEIPHIPVNATGFKKDLELIATTNWQPYTWSVNNVALAENLHMALAYWQGGNSEKAYKLWESALLESMYLGASPGSFQQLSFYDAMRGELYRDFADPIGMAARSLTEGLFGIRPDALHNTLNIVPGFPESWKHASLQLPNVGVAFKKENSIQYYHITQNLAKKLELYFEVPVEKDQIEKITVNGKQIDFQWKTTAFHHPKISLKLPYAASYEIAIHEKGTRISPISYENTVSEGGDLHIETGKAKLVTIADPQGIIESYDLNSNTIHFKNTTGNKSFFATLTQRDCTWRELIAVKIQPKVVLLENKRTANAISCTLSNNTKKAMEGDLWVMGSRKSKRSISIAAASEIDVDLPLAYVTSGTNRLLFTTKEGTFALEFQEWEVPTTEKTTYEMVNLQSYFNSNIKDIFNNQYSSPRPQRPTLQLPTTGIGNWCYPWISKEVQIDDSGLQQLLNTDNSFTTSEGIPFRSPKTKVNPNIAFTSQWDVFPEEIKIPLSGKAKHAYLLLAGTTNPMQSRITNGMVTVQYTDGSTEKLPLKNPENWWPIEQDYYTDGYAFTTDAPKPLRLYLKSGKIRTDFSNYTPIHGYSDYAIDGGAATILDIPLNPKKTLKNITLTSIANDVVMGLMSLTLQRK